MFLPVPLNLVRTLVIGKKPSVQTKALIRVFNHR